jgi:two-component system LytT family sensor kinase
MKIFRYRYFNLIIHVLTWCVVLFFPLTIARASDQFKIGPHPGLYFTLSGAVHCIIFYANALLLFPKLLNRTYWLVYTAATVLLIFVSYKVKFFFIAVLFPDELQDFVHWHILFSSVIAFIASVIYSVTVEKIRADKMQKENEAMQLGMELKFLRSQISPHFLFNTLTNLVFLARKKSDRLESWLLMLSSLMRYMLYDAGKKISIKQEIEYLESYVTLQELRFGRDVKIVFATAVSPEDANCSIESMLLIPFAENAFKHGTGYVDHPYIDINLTVKERVLVFKVKNKFDRDADKSKDESSGIGLSNVRSRLTLLYPGRYELVIHDDKGLFSIELIVKL